MPGEFKNKKILITGAASGIGFAIAKLAMQQGAQELVLFDIDYDGSAVDVVNKKTILSKIKLDVSNLDNWKKIVQHIGDDEFDLLIVSAGVQLNLDITEKRLKEINIWGAQNTYYALHKKLKRTEASIIFLSSDLITTQETNAYIDSKRKIAEFAYTLGKVTNRHRVLTLLPGPVLTGLFTQNKTYEEIEKIKERMQIFEPTEFAAEVAAIYADEQKFPTSSFIRMYKGEPLENVDMQFDNIEEGFKNEIN